MNSEGVVLDYPNDGAPLIAKPDRIPDAENDANLIANLSRVNRELSEALAAARAKADTPKGNGTEHNKAKIVLHQVWEIVTEMREPNWLLRNILEAAVLAVLAGARSTFKSFIALDWMMRIALEGYTVVILSGEGAGLGRRVEAWMQTHAPDVDLKALSIYVFEHPLNLSAIADMEGLREALLALGKPVAAVMVDTFSKFAAGVDENDNTEVAGYLAVLSECIRDEFNCTVLLVAHSGHGDQKRPRGASALMANPDAEYIVDRRTRSG